MDSANILSGGLEELNRVKEVLLKLNENQLNSASFLKEEERLEKGIENLEKELAEEIAKTTKKRRQEIEVSFDGQLEKLQARTKRIKDKREKNKNRKVSQRIETETEALKKDNIKLREETKLSFKQKHIPAVCNTKLYYALYSPSCFTDYILILGALLLTLLLIPCGIYYLLLPEEKILYLVLIYIISVILFGGGYILTGNRIKVKFIEDIIKVKGIRKEIRINKKKIRIIRNNVRKDHDESSYELQTYDKELSDIEQEIAEVMDKKKEALTGFDHSTAKIISDEIKGSYEEKLSSLREEHDKASTAFRQAEDQVKALTLRAASEFEPFLGKEMVTLQKIESLIGIIQAGNAGTISEALTFHKKMLSREENTIV